MMADNVPAVQALGQCIFLPMLIIGGVAVPLASLPDWAQRLSSFFPGRYAVEALQACVNGNGLTTARFSASALVLIGAAGAVAGAKMFRWDAEQRFSAASGKGWVVVALAAWVAVGVTAETRSRVSRQQAPTTQAATTQAAPTPVPPPTETPQPPAVTSSPSPSSPTTNPTPAPHPVPTTPAAAAPRSAPSPTPPGTPSAPAATPPPPSSSTPDDLASKIPSSPAATWRAVTMADIDRDLIFTRLPPDSGIVTPIAAADDEPDPDAAGQLEQVRLALPSWKPGKVDDPVQRVRNFLFVAAVVDVFQMENLERFLPHVIFERVQTDVPKEDLIKILYWIALHPADGNDHAVDELRSLGLTNGPGDMDTTRERAAIYAVKLLGRITGKIASQ